MIFVNKSILNRKTKYSHDLDYKYLDLNNQKN